jgi:hypothetical protein
MRIQQMSVLARVFPVLTAVNQLVHARRSLLRQERSSRWLMHHKTSLATAIAQKAAAMVLHHSSRFERRCFYLTAPTKSVEALPFDASRSSLNLGLQRIRE